MPRQMSSPIVFALLLLSPGVASAATLYRCINSDGSTSYQSRPCERDQRLDATMDYQPDPMPPMTSRDPVTPAKSRRATYGYRRVSSRRVTDDSPSARCRRAKARRAQETERLGLQRTFEDLSRMDAAVRDVCHGF